MKFAGVIIAGLVLVACGDGESEPAVGSQAHLEAQLEAEKAALVEGDIETLHAIQGEQCQYTIEEVREGYEFGIEWYHDTLGGAIELVDLVADLEYAVIEFDEETSTARVRIRYAGSNQVVLSALEGEEESEASETAYWLGDDDVWVGSACVAEGFDLG